LGEHEIVASDEALYESVVFLDYFSDLPDPRQLIKVVYPLDEVLLLLFFSGSRWGCDFERQGPEVRILFPRPTFLLELSTLIIGLGQP
jgi:hypothetical protein